MKDNTDRLLEKYIEKIARIYVPFSKDTIYHTDEMKMMASESLLLKFLIEYIELREKEK